MGKECIVAAEFAHETNTFADDRTTRDHFRERRELFGTDVRQLEGTNTAIGGVISVANQEGIELSLPVATAAMPGGIVAETAYEFYTDRILDEIAAVDVDGILLALHGAMVTETHFDGEGVLLRNVRDAVGPDIPIVATYDLHGNVTEEMIESADATIAYETYPHVDTGATGERGMRLLLRSIRGEISPTTALERPPILPYGPQQNTREGPMAEVMDEARDLESRPEVLKVNVFPGFHQADIPDMGFSIPVVTDDDEELARSVARELAAETWARRSDFIVDYPTPNEAVNEAVTFVRAAESYDGPVVLADLGDNPGGGGAADGTTILRELIDQEVTDAGFAILRDPEAVEQSIETGVGNRVTLTIGGKTDDRHGDPIEAVNGYVAAITDGEFENTGPMGTGTETHLGRTVRFECGTDDGITVILTENRVQPLDAEIWRHVGIQPERLDILVVKSTNHFRADYEPLSSEVLLVDSPGLVAVNPARFEYAHVRRPKCPIDSMPDNAYPDWE